MRSPNGQSCCLGGNVETSLTFAIVMAGDIVWRCEPIFDHSVETGQSVTFEFSDEEIALLARLYPEIDNEALLVKTFLNCTILMQKKMPYEISSILRIAGTSRFSCKMVSELPVHD